MIEVEHLFAWSELGPTFERRARDAVALTRDGTVLALSMVEEVQRRVPRRHGAGSTIERLFRYRVTAWRDGVVWQSEVTEPIGAVNFVQPLGDAVLVVGARCEDRRLGPVPNAYVVAWSGEARERWFFGDAIADVRAGDAVVWCSYFDQGVCAYDRWGPDGESMGGWGVRPFDRGGVALSLHGALDDRSIIDVYAMNLCSDDDVWIYPYTSFDVLRLHKGAVTSAATTVRGAHALGVQRGRALLIGDYQRRDRAVEQTLHNARSTEHELQFGWELSDPSRLRAQGLREQILLWDDAHVGLIRDW